MVITDEAVLHLVQLWQKLQKLGDAYVPESCEDRWNLFHSLAASVEDALYLMSGEQADDYSDSQTFRLLHSDRTADEVTAALLNA